MHRKGAEAKALPPAFGSKSVHTGIVGEFRVREGLGDQTRHLFVICLCGNGLTGNNMGICFGKILLLYSVLVFDFFWT